MRREFDVVVIGSGSAARAAANPLASAGKKVAMIDSLPFGGTCALRGCDPKKVLVGAADVVDQAARLQGKGVSGVPAIAWPELMAFKRTFTDPFPAGTVERLEKAGIAVVHGRAAFESAGSLNAGGDTLAFEHCVIASGARPAPLGIPGQDLAVTSDGFLELAALPPRIVFIGGGYIAFEFAHIAARAGASVAIVHRGSRPLEIFDADLVDRLLARTRELGIEVRLDSRVTGIVPKGAGFTVQAEAAGGTAELSADLVVHAAGRIPDIDDLNLEAAGVAREKRGIRVDAHLRSTTNPAVYAAGDVAASGLPPLTPVAGYEGSIVAHNLLHEEKRRTDSLPIPSVVFTVPPLASVGMTEEEARRSGKDVKARLVDTAGWYSSRRIGETHSAAKIVVEDGTGRILGAALLGPGAEETINLFALAMRSDIKAHDLKTTLFAYPTHASDLQYLL